MNRREVTARIRVSRFSRALSRVRRISAGAKRLKTSSDDSGSSQNYEAVSACPETGRDYVAVWVERVKDS